MFQKAAETAKRQLHPQQFMSKLKEFRSIHKDQMMNSLLRGNKVDPCQQTTMRTKGNACPGVTH